jgi:predicted transcriptional regulator
MVRVRKGAVQIRFEILEYLFYNREPQPRTYVWRKATSLAYDDFLKHLSYLKQKSLVKETGEGQCLLTEKGRNIYVELRNLCLQSCRFGCIFGASQLIFSVKRFMIGNWWRL